MSGELEWTADQSRTGGTDLLAWRLIKIHNYYCANGDACRNENNDFLETCHIQLHICTLVADAKWHRVATDQNFDMTGQTV